MKNQNTPQKYTVGTPVIILTGVFKDQKAIIISYRASDLSYKLNSADWKVPDIVWYQTEIKPI